MLLTSDPYVAFLLERHPEGLSLTSADREVRIATVIDAGTDLVVCEHDDPRLSELRRVIADRLLVLAPPGTDVDGLRTMARPLSAERLLRAVDEPAEGTTPRFRDDPFAAVSARYPWGVAASGAAAAVAAGLGDRLHLLPVAGAVTVYGLVRTRLRWPLLLALDVAVAAGTAIATGGVRSPLVVLSLVVAAGLGLRARLRDVVVGSALISVANAAGTAIATEGTVDLVLQVQTLLTFLLIALLAASGRDRSLHSDLARQSRVSTLLAELRDLAASDPGALRLDAIVDDALRGALEQSGASEGVLLLDGGDELEVVAAQGLSVRRGQTAALAPGTHVAVRGSLLDGSSFGPVIEEVVRGPVTTVPLLDDGRRIGLLLVHGDVGRRARGRLLEQAAIAGTRIGNALSFARLRTDSVDEERRRLAGELHDSTAQVLAHVRFELELLAREGTVTPEDLRRLARATGRAQADLRDVINGLRASVGDDGLAGALRAYVADLRTRSGPVIRFRSNADHVPDPIIEREVFRIAQEAISNAVRHANADSVTVDLLTDGGELVLRVDDDGRGLPDAPRDGGLGLVQMDERASRIGGRLDLDSTSRGTRLTLRVPLRDRPTPAGERPLPEGLRRA